MRRSALACAMTTLLLCGGCGAPPVEIAPAPGSTGGPCIGVRWPSEVAGMEQADRTPAVASTMAWADGRDPAIIGRCGVPTPGPTKNECIAVDGIDWVAERLDDGMRFTTYGRTPAVEVLVPNRYAPEPLVLPAFADAARVGTRQGPGCS